MVGRSLVLGGRRSRVEGRGLKPEKRRPEVGVSEGGRRRPEAGISEGGQTQLAALGSNAGRAERRAERGSRNFGGAEAGVSEDVGEGRKYEG